jgi:hypothetical protein
VYQSHFGWTHDLRTYNVYREGDNNPFDSEMTMTAFENDDLQLLQQLFQNRILTPFDEIELYRYNDTFRETLLGVSIQLFSGIGLS